MPHGTLLVLYFLFAASLVLVFVGFWIKIQAYRRGGHEIAWDRPRERLKRLLRLGVFQAKTARKKYAGPMHQLIYWGFIVLLIGTILVLIDYDITLPLLGSQFLKGNFYLLFEFLLDLFGVLFLAGLGMAIRRRWHDRPEALYNKPQDVWILGSLTLLGIQGFLLESLRLAIERPAWAPFSFVGYALNHLWTPLSMATRLNTYHVVWWFHALTFFAWFASLPYTKMQHVVTAPANLFFAQHPVQLHKGELNKPFDLAQAMETGNLDLRLGARRLEDFSWRQLLSVDACTECGRCQEECPAYAAGRPLSPMKVVLDLRGELHRQTNAAWKQSMAARGRNPYAAAPVEPMRANGDGNQLVNGVIQDTTLWSCVTCRACMEACPVGIEHVPLIVDMRRGLVMESRLDTQKMRLLNNLANTGNAYGFPTADRAAWAESLAVPKITEVDPGSLEVLYWVGCSGSYDSRNQKVSRALIKILKAAKVQFAILGSEERCTGDPARRLGEESRFQELVLQNAETLKKYRIRRVIAQCPHCFNTLRNEYRRFGVELEVEHHSQFIARLMKSGRLKVPPNVLEEVTYHDPCYLGRYNDEYDRPRAVLSQIIRGPLKEMGRSHEQSFCCGAGGSNMWFEVKEERERMSQIRLKEAKATGASRLATACPFCMTMFDDAARVAGDESFQVKDVAELVAEALDRAAP